MKKLSPRKFQKLYFISVFTLILLWLIFIVTGVILIFIDDNPLLDKIGITLICISFLFLISYIIIIAKGRKRILNIDEEIIEEELNKPIEELNPIKTHWIKMKPFGVEKDGRLISFSEEGLQLDESDFILWDDIKHAELIEHFITLGKEPFKEELWEGVIILVDQFSIKLLEKYLKCPLDKEVFEELQNEYVDLLESTQVWKYNWQLLIEKILFISFILFVGIITGLFFIFNKILDQSIATIIVNLLTIPAILIGLPKLFKDVPKKRFMINKEGLGYSKGRYHIYIPWYGIIKININKRKINLTYRIFNQDGYESFDTFDIPRNKLLEEKISEYKDKYQLSFVLEQSIDTNV